MCDTKQLSNKVYQFDGFSFYHSLEKPNCWLEHGHEEIQITLPQNKAQAWIQYQSSTGKSLRRKVKPGQSCLIAQNQFHRLDWQSEAELTLFYLHPRFFANAINNPVENNHLEICASLAPENDTLIQKVGAIFRYLCNSGMAMEKLYIENLANLLAVHLLKNYLDYSLKADSFERGLSQKTLKSVLEYIEANLDRKITLSDLASIAGIGKFYFCRLFKNSLNLTPYQYVLQQRMKRAKEMLRYSNSPICDVALDCGFSSQSHLTKHFRKMVNTSPMTYRKNIR